MKGGEADRRRRGEEDGEGRMRGGNEKRTGGEEERRRGAEDEDEETFWGYQVVAQLLKCDGGFGENSGGFKMGIRICGFLAWKNTIDLTQIMLSFGNGAL